MTNRGRGFMSGGVWDGEYDSQSIVDIKARLDALETPTVPGGTTTLTGTPQAQGDTTTGSVGPGFWAIAARLDKDGLVYYTFQFTSLASTLRRFWIYLRKVKSNGNYGKSLVQRIVPTAAEIAANHIEVEFQKGLLPKFRYDLVLIEAKLTDDSTNDGGNRDQDPDPYTAATAPTGAQLATVNGVSGQPGNPAPNYASNAKFKWNSVDWLDIRTSGGVAIVSNDNSPPLGATDCAKWRYALTQNSGMNTTVANGNYWSISGPFAGQLTMSSSNAAFDPSNRMKGAPFNKGEAFNVAFTALMGGAWSATEMAFPLTITLYDEGLGITVATTTLAVGQYISRSEWRFIQMPGVLTSASWIPTGRQWTRWHLGGTLAAGNNLHIDKVLVSSQQGAYSNSLADQQQDNPPSTTSGGSSSGSVGTGSQPGDFTLGTGGAYLNVSE